LEKQLFIRKSNYKSRLGCPGGMTSKDNKREYSTVSLHNKVIEEIDRVMDELGFWPSRSTFVREACLEKIKRERQAAKTDRRTRHLSTNRKEEDEK